MLRDNSWLAVAEGPAGRDPEAADVVGRDQEEADGVVSSVAESAAPPLALPEGEASGDGADEA